MPLVEYPDSDSDTPSPAQPSSTHHHPHSPPSTSSLKRKRTGASQERSQLPPLPAAFHDLYSTNARASTSDDPSLHGGRRRAVPHVEGNWPTHVYLEWVPSQAESRALLSTIDHVREEMKRANSNRKRPLPVPDIIPSLSSPLGAPLPLHISLSRTMQLKTENREIFLETLTQCLRKAAVVPFDIDFTSLKWAPNFERNRWFLVLGIAKPLHDELNRLLQACNTAAEIRGHPGLYSGGKGDGPLSQQPLNNDMKPNSRTQAVCADSDLGLRPIDRSNNFHISIAWTLTEPEEDWITLTQNIDVSTMVEQTTGPFGAVKAKIGNVVHSILLGLRGSSLDESSSLLGLQ